ncbi:MAG: DUF3109 family protein [Chitinophagales bacterium]|nr:DUF3109 family protein [Chitinophagaceae bacterium]MCB9065753.1 DUF3109 family protein [Chitinophagales bacterium]
MIAIDNVLVSDDVVKEQFVCDLTKCKGGCCVDGDCGAPLTEEETKLVADNYPAIKKYLPEKHILEVEQQGTHTIDDEFGYVTPTINGGVCVYAYTDFAGIVKCGFERAWREGEIAFQKPISCHLYPIRIKQLPDYEAVNYSPRKILCAPACTLGEKLRVPVYQFLKDALIRKYGPDFYDALDATAKHMNE